MRLRVAEPLPMRPEYLRIEDAEGVIAAEIHIDPEAPESRELARRLVAAINLLVGVPTHDLERIATCFQDDPAARGRALLDALKGLA